MNELPSARDLPHGHQEARRTHLISEMTRTPAARRVAPLRLAIGGLATTAVAVGAVALVIMPSGEVGGKAPLIRVENAAEVLGLASTAAARQPELKPRPDQYLYFESESLQTNVPGQSKVANRRKVWLPVDGQRAGLLLNKGDEAAGDPRTWLCDEAPQDGSVKKEGLPRLDLENPPSGCRTKAVFRNDLPTSGAAMRTWLYRHSQGGNPPDVQAFTTVFETVWESYVPPAALSAMFAAAAKLPGVTTANAKDMAGREGIAVGQTWHGIRYELIFAPKTYQLLGEREVVNYDNSFRPSGGKDAGKPWTPDRKLSEGTVLFSTAILRTAVTDKAGQPPTG